MKHRVYWLKNVMTKMS